MQKAKVLGPVKGMTRTKANEELSKLVTRALGVTNDARITLGGFVNQCWKPLYVGRWRKSTKAINEYLLKIIEDRFGTAPLDSISHIAMQSWLTEIAKKRCSSTIMHLRIFLRSIFAEAVYQKFLDTSPAHRLDLPKMRAVQHPYLTMEQIANLLEAASPFGLRTRERIFLQLALTTAMRPSEIFALRWRSVDLVAGTMSITETVYRGELRPYGKTTESGESDVLVVPGVVVDALTELRSQANRDEADDFIFPTSVGTFWQKENYLQRVLQPLAKQAGIPHINYQMLRRTTLTWAGQHGDLKSVQAIARHRSAEVTANVYMQTINPEVRATSERLAGSLFALPAPAKE
jgi:integrase